MTEEVKAKLVRQLEFYFGDSNLPKDRFLKGKVAEEPTGYVDLKIVIAFARMRELLKVASVAPDQVPAELVQSVAEVLRTRSTTLEVDEAGLRLRRKQPMKDEEALSQEIEARSLFVTPFPHNVHIDQLTEFFAKYAPVNCVRMRRHPAPREPKENKSKDPSRGFKGSLFVEFASVEEMEKVLGMSLTYAGAPLRMDKKLDFLTKKAAKRAQKQIPYDQDFSNDDLSDGVGGTVGGPVVEGRQAFLDALPPKVREA